MELPFTRAQFFDVFVTYNTSVWPLQLVFTAAAVLVVTTILLRWRGAPRLTLVAVALLWLWMGVVYHYVFFRPVNPAAAGFAAVFVVEALLLLHAARSHHEIALRPDWRGLLGAALVAYGLLIYPIVGHIVGHRYPAAPTFGLPCPTTLFTMGVLLWLRPSGPGLFIIPVLWSVIGLTAALRLGVYEDGGLAVAALAGIAAIILGIRHQRKSGPEVPAVAP